MLSWLSGNKVPETTVAEKVDFLRYLAQKLSDWIKADAEGTKRLLAQAINTASDKYLQDHDGIVEGIRGSQAPVQVAGGAGVLTQFWAYTQTGIQMTRNIAADYVVDPLMSNKALELRAKFGGGPISPEKAADALLHFREEKSGWTSDRVARRTSLNTLVVHYIVQAYLQIDATTSGRFITVLGSNDFLRGNAAYAYDFYVMTIGILKDNAEYSARFRQ